MKDVNYPLRKAYFAALSGITYGGVAVPVYYGSLPEDEAPVNYIIFGGLTHNDDSTKNSADTVSLMKTTIHTYNNKYNDGKAADVIGGIVYQRIYPDSHTNLDLSADGLQITGTTFSNDFTNDFVINKAVVYVDRTLIFRHTIYVQ